MEKSRDILSYKFTQHKFPYIRDTQEQFEFDCPSP